eukprot:365941-Chlamydomonas_euryale.AAC.7
MSVAGRVCTRRNSMAQAFARLKLVGARINCLRSGLGIGFVEHRVRVNGLRGTSEAQRFAGHRVRLNVLRGLGLKSTVCAAQRFAGNACTRERMGIPTH